MGKGPCGDAYSYGQPVLVSDLMHDPPSRWASFAPAAVDVVTRTILVLHAGVPEELLMTKLQDGGAYRAEVHQASEMISVQLQISVGHALARLRARAFALDRSIGDVAADVVARRLRFDR